MVATMKNSPDSSGWMIALAALFSSYAKMQGILEMPYNTVHSLINCKASWRCHPLTDSRTFHHDEATDSSLLKNIGFIVPIFSLLKYLLRFLYLQNTILCFVGSNQFVKYLSIVFVQIRLVLNYCEF